ncbi:MAG: IPT/TIG domain-containing protein [Bacteroidota bacterium]
MKAGFFFLAPPPTITSFAPTSTGAGGTIVITGTNLTGAVGVNFGGTAASSFTVVSPTTINAVVGGGTSGIVSLATLSGTAFLPGFTFVVQQPPTITSISPQVGGSGTTVFITGTNFIGVSSVTFGGVEATSFNTLSITSLSAKVGTGASGDVTVTTPGGSVTATGFTYFPPPTVTSFTPTSAAAGDVITITGTDFTNVSGVQFGGVPASSFTVVSATSITAVLSPVGASGNVSVLTAGGTGSLAGFTFLLPKIVVKDDDNNAGMDISSNQIIDLGSIFPGESITKTVSISNVGNALLYVIDVDLTHRFQ